MTPPDFDLAAFLAQLPERLQQGRPEPMGTLVRDGGVNVCVFSQHGRRVELCVFDADGRTELRRYALHGPHDQVFHGFLPGAGPGLVYGLRAHGPYAPEAGHRFNPHKLLLDPWAQEIVGRFQWRPEHHGYVPGHPDGARTYDTRDNALHALKARVARPPGVAAARANAPRHAPSDLVLYEVHVKGFSQRLPGVPERLRGTYAAMAHPAAVAHFKALGVTALSLLPVQYHLDEPHLAARGATNHWGYNTLGFFCPDPRFGTTPDDPGAVAEEFRAMVHALHEAGLEVILDVVYNHTPEGDENGPTISFRGLDNSAWYRLAHDDASRSENLTGCGNTLHVAHHRVAQFVLDSLRHWVQAFGVDGFRFDLAPVLGRTRHGFDPHAPFFTALRQDPLLAQVHLIAEPWDAGPHGYQVGRFPGRFMEWNDKFRDTVRGYWLGRHVTRGEFARRFTASNDLFHHAQRRPSASVNFVAAHDGFTLMDMVSYAGKHNHANGEHNRDGRSDEPSANFGIEGPTPDPAVNARRRHVGRAMLATLMLAQGTPMLNAGDEIGRTQLGNNNAYCQDNELSWHDWAKADLELAAFVGRLAALRREEPVLRHDDWFTPDAADTASPHVEWSRPDGQAMLAADWHDTAQSAFACRLNPAQTPGGAHRRAPLLLCFNPAARGLAFTLPAGDWRLLLDSSDTLPDGRVLRGHLEVPAHALLVLRGPAPQAADALLRSAETAA